VVNIPKLKGKGGEVQPGSVPNGRRKEYNKNIYNDPGIASK
jgi:hypothetical protein